MISFSLSLKGTQKTNLSSVFFLQNDVFVFLQRGRQRVEKITKAILRPYTLAELAYDKQFFSLLCLI
jgi:hypothetical protein